MFDAWLPQFAVVKLLMLKEHGIHLVKPTYQQLEDMGKEWSSVDEFKNYVIWALDETIPDMENGTIYIDTSDGIVHWEAENAPIPPIDINQLFGSFQYQPGMESIEVTFKDKVFNLQGDLESTVLNKDFQDKLWCNDQMLEIKFRFKPGNIILEQHFSAQGKVHLIYDEPFNALNQPSDKD